MRVDTVGAVADALEEWEREHHWRAGVLQWTMALRPDLRPDMFVQITDVPYIGLPESGVYQIVEHVMGGGRRDRAGATSTFRAMLVAEADLLTPLTTGGLWEDETDNIPDLEAVATGGLW
jgi:hypothetical protein